MYDRVMFEVFKHTTCFAVLVPMGPKSRPGTDLLGSDRSDEMLMQA